MQSKIDPVEQQVRDILKRDNVTEPSGEWSVYDIARQLDPEARNPASMFDTGKGTQPRSEYVEMAQKAVDRISPGARYVGGTSRYLYSL